MGLFDEISNGFEKLTFMAKDEHIFRITGFKEVKSEKTGDAIVINTTVLSEQHKGKTHDFYCSIKRKDKNKNDKPGILVAQFMKALSEKECEAAAESCGGDILDQFDAAVRVFVSGLNDKVGIDVIATFRAVTDKGYQNVEKLKLKEEVEVLKDDSEGF